MWALQRALLVLAGVVPGLLALRRVEAAVSVIEAPRKRKSKGATPTARSLAECRKRGWLAGVVERRLPKQFVTVDLFGFIDIVALDGRPGVLAIQATADSSKAGYGSDVARRVAKITTERADNARAWLAAGNRIEVWGWGKKGAAGTRKLWTLRVVPVESVEALADLALGAADAS